MGELSSNDEVYKKDDIDKNFQSGDVLSESEDTNSTSGFVQKCTITFNALMSGYYIIQWYYEVSNEHNTKRTEVRIQLDDTADLGRDLSDPTNNNNYHQKSGFAKNELSAGNHKIDIDYRSLSNGGVSKIRNARIYINKI